MRNNNGRPSIGHVVNNRFSRRRFRRVRANDQYELFKSDLHEVVEQTFLYHLVVEASHKAFPEVSYSLGTKVWPIIGDLRYQTVFNRNLLNLILSCYKLAI